MSRTVSKGNLNLKQLEILKCLLTTTQENQDLLEAMLVELEAINANTDEVENLLTTINESINTQTDTLEDSLQAIEDTINQQTQDLIVELVAIKDSIDDMSQELQDKFDDVITLLTHIDGDLHSILSTLNSALTQLQEINADLDTTNAELAAVNTKLDTIIINIGEINDNLADILAELGNIEADIEAGNATLTAILTKLNDLQVSLEAKLDTINASINTMNTNLGTKLDTLDVSVNAVITAVQALQTALVAELVDVRNKLQTIIDKPEATEIPICYNKSNGASLVKEFDENGNEIVVNRKFYEAGVQISEPVDWVEGDCVQFKIDSLIADIKAGNVSLNDIKNNTDLIVSELQAIDANTDEIETKLDSVKTSIDTIIPYVDEVEPKLDSILAELQKLTDSNLPFHEVLTGITKTYSNFNSITFTVFDGTAVITVGGSAVTFPLSGSGGDILGANWTAEQLASQPVTINAAGGSVYVSTIS